MDKRNTHDNSVNLQLADINSPETRQQYKAQLNYPFRNSETFAPEFTRAEPERSGPKCGRCFSPQH